MKKNRWPLRAVTALLIAGVLMVTVVAVETGTAADPLVSLSYLQETYLGQILANVESLLTSRDARLKQEVDEKIAAATGGASGGTAAAFTAVTLKRGQILTGDAGCEVMLRAGEALCAADADPGLVDQTDGTTLAGGKPLKANHLYMMTTQGHGVSAAAESVTLLVRGAYVVD